jgi:hypothetical protein
MSVSACQFSRVVIFWRVSWGQLYNSRHLNQLSFYVEYHELKFIHRLMYWCLESWLCSLDFWQLSFTTWPSWFLYPIFYLHWYHRAQYNGSISSNCSGQPVTISHCFKYTLNHYVSYCLSYACLSYACPLGLPRENSGASFSSFKQQIHSNILSPLSFLTPSYSGISPISSTCSLYSLLGLPLHSSLP